MFVVYSTAPCGDWWSYWNVWFVGLQCRFCPCWCVLYGLLTTWGLIIMGILGFYWITPWNIGHFW